MIKSFLRKVKHSSMFLLFFSRAVLASFGRPSRNKLFVFGTPIHGNLGDQAIAYAEQAFLKQECNRKMVEIPSQFVEKYMSVWRWLVGRNGQIAIHGGGFVGSIWPSEDRMLRKVVSSFGGKQIIILPQTVYFDSEHTQMVDSFRELLVSHGAVDICAREMYSFNAATKDYDFPNVKLVPDMVTYLSKNDVSIDEVSDRDSVLLCLRHDREKVNRQQTLEEIEKMLAPEKLILTDTVVEHSIYPWQRRRAVSTKINEFRQAKLVVTDRLHGMVFAAIAGTPCLVLSNNNYKIKGVYEWIKNNTYVRFVDEQTDNIHEIVTVLLTMKKNSYENDAAREKFNVLQELVGGNNVPKI